MKSYYLISLGCPKNLVDSEYFAGIMESAGYRKTDRIENTDVTVINTCGFIRSAKEEAIQEILEAVEQKNNGNTGKLIVTGCLVKRYKCELQREIPEVDHYIDLKDFESFRRLFDPLPRLLKSRLTLPHYAYLRISDGCNNRCSYCSIPAIRGKLKSESVETLVREAEVLAASGVKELILTAQDTTAYGRDNQENLIKLLERLQETDGIKWIRLLYLHPVHMDSELLDAFNDLPKLLPYFDIPLQHINDNLLKSMNRKTDSRMIKLLLDQIRNKLPQAAIRTTFIVGYPGETEKRFRELRTFVEEQKFTRLGIFCYSREDGTPAYDLKNTVSQKTAEYRRDLLMKIQEEISSELLSRFVGRKMEVIVDRKSPEENFNFEGRSYLDAPEIDGTVFITGTGLKPGAIIDVSIMDSWEHDLIGEFINEREER